MSSSSVSVNLAYVPRTEIPLSSKSLNGFAGNTQQACDISHFKPVVKKVGELFERYIKPWSSLNPVFKSGGSAFLEISSDCVSLVNSS